MSSQQSMDKSRSEEKMQDPFYWALQRFGKGFAIGFAARALLKLLPKLLKSGNLVAVVKSLFEMIPQKEGPVAYGVFLGSLFSIFETIMRASNGIEGLSRCQSSLLAGGTAGFISLLFLPESHRSTIASFIVVRALEFAAQLGVAASLLPNIPHADTLTMMAASAVVIGFYLAKPDGVDSSYTNFLNHHGGKPRPIPDSIAQYLQFDGKFTPEVKTGLDKLTTQGKWPAIKWDDNSSSIVHRILHPNQSSCNISMFEFVIHGLKRALPVYLPVHILPLLIFKWKRLLKDPLPTLLKTAIGLARSSLFLAVYCGGCWRGICATHSWPLPWLIRLAIPGMCGGLATLLEVQSRRIELALYVLSHALQGGERLLREKGFIPSVPLGSSIAFGLSTAIILYVYVNRPELMRPTFFSFFKFCFGAGGKDAGFPQEHPVIKQQEEQQRLQKERQQQERQQVRVK